MSFEDIILDLKCVSMGLPPLSGPVEEVTSVIRSLDSREKRRVNRKIKKLCKKFISEKFADRFSHSGKSSLERRLGFKRDDQLFNSVILARRVSFVRRNIVMHEMRKERQNEV